MSDPAELPFQPIRNTLYSSRELLRGFLPEDPQSMGRTPDFLSYVYFVRFGRAAPTDPHAGMMQGLHDNSILRAMYAYLRRDRRPTAAIMGGHREERGSATYRQVTALAKRLTEEGFLMASGGGPGCMEATHLGALLAGRTLSEVDAAIDLLSTEAKLPPTYDIVSPDGSVSPELVGALHRWAMPATEVMERFERGGGASLAVPTWHYGHEPISPLATHVAKYFLNSIREDVLLALASSGIIFSPGRAGTLQEVFQDAAQNYYAAGQEPFAPMVFWDTKFWTDQMPVRALLEALFMGFKGMTRDQFDAKILFTDDVDEAVAFLQAGRPSDQAADSRFEALGLEKRFRLESSLRGSAEEAEIEAVLAYLYDLEWEAEWDHYGGHGGTWDRDVHGRVYAIRDLTALLQSRRRRIPDPTREDILEDLESLLAPLEPTYEEDPNNRGREIGGRVLVLREIRAAILGGYHHRPRPPRGGRPAELSQ